MDELEKDLNDNARQGGRAANFKLKEKDNNVVILTNPIGYSEAYGVGIAYEDCGYGKFASRKYKCYIKDLADGQIKIMNMSYTVAKALLALSKGGRTQFEGFPMPYAVNLYSENAGTKEVKTQIIANDDYTLSDEDRNILAEFSPIQEIIDRLKAYQKKEVETNPEMQDKITRFLEKKATEEKEREEKKKKDKEIGKGAKPVETIEYPEGAKTGDIPF